jgi:purine-binding chemotaxis protein CheW
VRLEAPTVRKKYVVFRIGEGCFGIALQDVATIIRFDNVTDVPTAPSYVEGVLNLGGEVIPVVNLRVRLSLPREAPSRQHRVVVVARELRRFGLLVDGVREILELDDENILTGTTSTAGMNSEFVLGITKIQGALLVLLDIFEILAAPAEAVIRIQH